MDGMTTKQQLQQVRQGLLNAQDIVVWAFDTVRDLGIRNGAVLRVHLSQADRAIAEAIQQARDE